MTDVPASIRRADTSVLTASGHQADIYVPVHRISSQFRAAVRDGDVDRLERLWRALSARYNASSLISCLCAPCPDTSKSLMVMATEGRYTDLVMWLMAQNCESRGMTTSEGDTVLHIAARVGAADILGLYHTRFAAAYDEDNEKLVDWPNYKSMTPLAMAALHGQTECLTVLLALGAMLDVTDSDGNTPLHHASSYGHVTAVQRLIQAGANAFVQNNLGYTASDYAYSFDVGQVIQDAVRSALEISKRARNRSAPPKFRPPVESLVFESSEDEDSKSNFSAFNVHVLTESALPARPYPARNGAFSGAENILRDQRSLASPLLSTLPPLRVKNLNAGGSCHHSASPVSSVPPTPRLSEETARISDPSTESSRALQRIISRDQNAQAGFQAAEAIKGFTAAIGNAPSVDRTESVNNRMTSPRLATVNLARDLSTSSGKSAVTKAASDISSTDMSVQSTSSQSSTQPPSVQQEQPPPSSMTPKRTIRIPSAIPPPLLTLHAKSLPMIPVSVQPTLAPIPASPLGPDQPKSSSTMTFFGHRLHRSGSSSGATTSTGPKTEVGMRPPIKHHGSLMDLRASVKPKSAGGKGSAPPIDMAGGSYNALLGLPPPTPRSLAAQVALLTKPRKRAGT